MNTILLTDSCCDLPHIYVKENSAILDLIGMPINIGAYNFIDDLGAENYLHPEFYNQLRSGIVPKTAQITPIDFYKRFETYHKNGKTSIYLGFSSGMSGTYNNAVIAKNMILENYPDAKIDVIDSCSASIGQGILVMHVVKMIKNNISHLVISQWIEDNKMNSQHWFAVSDLMYLKNGDRIPSSIAAIGSLLNVKPILTVNAEGKLKAHSKVRGRKKSLRYLIEKAKLHSVDVTEPTIIIGHGNCPDDAELVKAMVTDEITGAEVIISEISATIATHVGPNMVALAFVGGQRE